MLAAYKLGWDAYVLGDDIDLNPYDEANGQHDEWDDGFSEAEFADSDPDIGN